MARAFVAIAAACTASCWLILGIDDRPVVEGSPAVDGAANDAGVDVADVPDAGDASDAAAPDAGRMVCGDAAHTFCDDFDDPADGGPLTYSRWSSTVRAEDFTRTMDGARSPPFALHFVKSAGDVLAAGAGSTLARELPLASQSIDCSMALRIASRPYPIRAMVITRSGTNKQVSLMLYPRPASMQVAVYEVYPDGGTLFDPGVTKTIDAGQNVTTVRTALHVDVQLGTFSLSVEGTTLLAGTFVPPDSVSANTMRAGAEGFSTTDAGIADFLFDDVACDVDQ